MLQVYRRHRIFTPCSVSKFGFAWFSLFEMVCSQHLPATTTHHHYKNGSRKRTLLLSQFIHKYIQGIKTSRRVNLQSGFMLGSNNGYIIIASKHGFGAESH